MSRTEHTLSKQKAVEKALSAFASRVFAHRTRHHLSRRALAEQVGCSESNIKNIETEESAPSFSVEHTLIPMFRWSKAYVKQRTAEIEKAKAEAAK